MASHPHIDDDDDFGGDFSGSHGTRRSGNKRSFGDLEDDEDDIFGSKKGNLKVEETAPGVATGMILSLRESLQNCKDALANCQTELEAAKAEIQKWHSAFQIESFIPAGTSPEPQLIVGYLQSLKSSEESLREQLEKAKKKEAAFIVTFAKREQEIAELKSAVRDLRVQLKPPSMQEKETGRRPQFFEIFKHTHLKKKDGGEMEQWMDQRSEKTYTDFQAARSSQSEESSTPESQHVIDTELWEKCAGNQSFGRVYGLGKRRSSSSSVNYPSSDSVNTSTMMSEMQSIRTQNEQLQSQVGDMQILISNLYKMFEGIQSGVPPTQPPTQSCPPAPVHESDSSSQSGDDREM